MSLMRFFTNLFDVSDFPARWQCGNWSAGHGWLHIASDLAIFSAYFAIPAALFYFVLRRRDVPLRGVFWLFIGFIAFCGITHLLDAIMFWTPVYRLSGVAKLATASVSWLTVIALVHRLPAALALPGVHKANEELRQEMEQRERLQQELASARDQLEKRSSQLTLRDRRFRAAMAAADACAVRWDADTGRFLWSLGAENCARLLELGGRALDDWDAVLAPGCVEALRAASLEAIEAGRTLEVVYDLREPPRGPESKGHGRLRVAACPDPDGEGGPRCMIGMFRLLLPESTC